MRINKMAIMKTELEQKDDIRGWNNENDQLFTEPNFLKALEKKITLPSLQKNKQQKSKFGLQSLQRLERKKTTKRQSEQQKQINPMYRLSTMNLRKKNPPPHHQKMLSQQCQSNSLSSKSVIKYIHKIDQLTKGQQQKKKHSLNQQKSSNNKIKETTNTNGFNLFKKSLYKQDMTVERIKNRKKNDKVLLKNDKMVHASTSILTKKKLSLFKDETLFVNNKNNSNINSSKKIKWDKFKMNKWNYTPEKLCQRQKNYYNEKRKLFQQQRLPKQSITRMVWMENFLQRQNQKNKIFYTLSDDFMDEHLQEQIKTNKRI